MFGRLLFALILGFAAPATAFADEESIRLVINDYRIAEMGTTLGVNEGDQLSIEVASDRDVTLHLHGYDLTLNVTAGDLALWNIRATHTGRFPLEIHGTGAETAKGPLLYLEVLPN
jgi:FtsP/CotA-like multicopper oxidase with cupredoxin domain